MILNKVFVLLWSRSMAFYHFEGIRRATNIYCTSSHNFQLFRLVTKESWKWKIEKRRHWYEQKETECNFLEESKKFVLIFKEKENGKYMMWKIKGFLSIYILHGLWILNYTSLLQYSICTYSWWKVWIIVSKHYFFFVYCL